MADMNLIGKELEVMTTITVCIGSSCHLKGSYDVISELQKLSKEHKLEDKVEIKASFCLGECTKAVSVKVDGDKVVSVNKNTVIDFFKDIILKNNP